MNQELFDSIYPIGSVFITLNNSPPKFGKWIKITDEKFIKSDDIAGIMGGSNTHSHTIQGHTLTIAEMPNHKHNFYGPNNMAGWPSKSEDTGDANDPGAAKYWRGGVGSYIESPVAETLWPSVWYVGSGSSHNHGCYESDNQPEFITFNAFYRVS